MISKEGGGALSVRLLCVPCQLRSLRQNAGAIVQISTAKIRLRRQQLLLVSSNVPSNGNRALTSSRYVFRPKTYQMLCFWRTLSLKSQNNTHKFKKLLLQRVMGIYFLKHLNGTRGVCAIKR